MKTAIKIVLIYVLCQILAAIVVSVPTTIYHYTTYGTIDGVEMNTIAPTMVLSMIFMTIYLWRAGYISTEKVTWSPISPRYLALTALICLASILIIEYLMWVLPSMPDLMEQKFELLNTSWLGILTVAVFAPILEELMFRGAITRTLLKKYNPTKAIILSALIFGIFHLNPVQIFSATLIGLLLGWIYYKTASLVPCILIHILNNSLSVYCSYNYPDVDYTWQLLTGTGYIECIVAIIIFAGAFFIMRKTTVPYPWKGRTEEQIEEQIEA